MGAIYGPGSPYSFLADVWRAKVDDVAAAARLAVHFSDGDPEAKINLARAQYAADEIDLVEFEVQVANALSQGDCG